MSATADVRFALLEHLSCTHGCGVSASWDWDALTDLHAALHAADSPRQVYSGVLRRGRATSPKADA